MKTSKLDTHQKALQVNLDSSKYGTIAEIGAGQEVSRWFFRVGAAAGTIASTSSAYDMGVSDAIYGKGTRYVSKDRLRAMLDHEWNTLLQRLDQTRGKDTTFFSFANTVSARNYKGTNICHGYMGIRFQTEARAEPNTVLLHLNMHDGSNVLQQQAVGILGVNLVYAAFHQTDSIKSLLGGLLDDLSLARIEVDYLELSGPCFDEVDQRRAHICLLQQELSFVVAFSAEGKPIESIELLYKRPIVLSRGRYQHVTPSQTRQLTAAAKQFEAEAHCSKRQMLEIFETSINSCKKQDASAIAEMQDRIDGLLKMGLPLLVSSYLEDYKITGFLRRYTSEPIRISAGMSHFIKLFAENNYKHLSGGIIEGMGRFIAADVKLYVHPMDVNVIRQQLEAEFDYSDWNLPESGELSLEDINVNSSIRHLINYLVEIGAVVKTG